MLTDNQKEFIDNNYKSIADLILLTRAVFLDETLDGRTKEGRAVRHYLAENNLEYNTTKHARVENVELTDDHKEFIRNNCVAGFSAVRLAQLAFKDESIKSLSVHHREVNKYVKQLEQEGLQREEEGPSEPQWPSSPNRSPRRCATSRYTPPETDEEILKKILEATHEEGLEMEKLTHVERECIKSLRRFLKAPRLKMILNNYTDMDDRELFEHEYVRFTWDKSDLTSDELNLYLNVCTDYISLKNISRQIEKLNIMFDEIESERELTVRYAEVLKTKNDEYDKCEKRMESLIKKLNGDRAERVKNMHQENATILSLVRSFQIEDERNRMLEIAEMQKVLLVNEAEKLESMDSWKARILGIDKRQIT